MTDYISRADAIEAVAEEWLSEASAESPYVNDYDIDKYRELAEDLFADIPSADAPKGDLISRQWLLEVYGDYIGDNGEPKYHVPLEVVRQNIKDAPSADAVSRVDCTDFLYWLIDEVVDEENWELNAVADGEIICRKLKKLGLLESKGGYYHDNSRATEESLRNAYYDGFNTASIEAQNVLADKVSVVRCKDCKHLEVINTENTYAICHEHDIIFEPFEDSTRTHFCSWGERREP